jgi:hypothetical protein
MLKNITLSAETSLIEAARLRAMKERTTLNAEFRRWLSDYARKDADGAKRVQAFREAMRKLRGHVVIGRKLTREELNER